MSTYDNAYSLSSVKLKKRTWFLS